MKTKIYVNNEHFIAGVTLKDNTEKEFNNMALHACQTPHNVLENRLKFSSIIQCSLDNFVCANQTHSANFYKVTASDRGRGSIHTVDSIPNTDALYTTEQNLLLCSFSADCVPVIFYNGQTGIAGVIHSGWQGTTQEITKKTLEHILNIEHCSPHDFSIIIGPALSQEKFEVDKDVYTKFLNLGYAKDFMYFNEQTSKYHIDNQLTVKKQCELAGIPATNITIDHMCTFASSEGFSYRQDKQSGRHLSFIMKK